MTTQVCTSCGQELPLTEEYFHKDKGRFRKQCKECRKAKAREAYYVNQEQNVLKARQYRKDHAEEIRTREAIRNSTPERIAYRKAYEKKRWAEDREERLQYNHEYYLANKDRLKEYKRQYDLKNKEQVKARRHEKYLANRETVIKQAREYRANNKHKISAYIKANKEKFLIRNQNRRARMRENGGDLTQTEWSQVIEYFDGKCAYCGKEEKLTLDHVVPVSKGGSTSYENVVCACSFCNSSKNNRDLDEWYPSQPFYSEERLEKIVNHTKGSRTNGQ